MENSLACLSNEILPEWGQAAVVDVETTGLSPDYDEILEIAIVLFAFERNQGRIMGIVDEYTGLREPSRSIPRRATEIHGITLKDVRGQKFDDLRVKELLEKADFLIAHNAKFDRGFLRKLYPFINSKKWLCSMEGINWYCKGFRSRSLQNLLSNHQIKVEQAHRATADVKGCLSLLNYNVANGKSYFYELLSREK